MTTVNKLKSISLSILSVYADCSRESNRHAKWNDVAGQNFQKNGIRTTAMMLNASTHAEMWLKPKSTLSTSCVSQNTSISIHL